jgi:lysophospholipase L1-like esterase
MDPRLLAAIAATLLAGCTSSSGTPAPAPRRPGTVVALGDSITQGQYAPPSAIATPYPAALQRLLGPEFTVDNLGVGGFRARDVLKRWRRDARGRGYAFAVVMAGVNDLWRGADADEAWVPLAALYDEILAEGIRLVAMTVTPFQGWTGDPWTARKQAALEELNRRIVRYCAERGCAVADAHAALADPKDPRSIAPGLDLGDHLHPSQAGLDRLAEIVRERIRR